MYAFVLLRCRRCSVSLSCFFSCHTKFRFCLFFLSLFLCARSVVVRRVIRLCCALIRTTDKWHGIAQFVCRVLYAFRSLACSCITCVAASTKFNVQNYYICIQLNTYLSMSFPSLNSVSSRFGRSVCLSVGRSVDWTDARNGYSQPSIVYSIYTTHNIPPLIVFFYLCYYYCSTTIIAHVV